MHMIKFFIQRCNLEPGTSFITYTQNVTEWRTEAFRYSNSGRAIHVECVVRICLQNEFSGLCSLCPISGAKRKKRNAEIITTEIALVKSESFVIIEQGIYQYLNIVLPW